MPEERDIAGIRCTQVLAELSDYLDEDLPTSRVQIIEAHLRGCDWCEHFGQEFSGVIQGLRAKLLTPGPPDVFKRLKQHLDEALYSTAGSS